MTVAPRLVTVLCASLLAAADLMSQGQWCFRCHQEAADECWEGTCTTVHYETAVELDHVEPDVDWGGGD